MECNDNTIQYLGTIYNKNKQGYVYSVYDEKGIAPTLLTNSIQNNKLYVLVREDEKQDLQN